MSSNEDIFEKIKKSLQTAKDTLHLKKKIENEISEVIIMLTEMTAGAIGFEIKNNDKKNMDYQSPEKIIVLKNKNMPFVPGFILCGYSINENTGYPVTVEDEENIYPCVDEVQLKTKISDIISSHENSMKIVNLASSNSDIPF